MNSTHLSLIELVKAGDHNGWVRFVHLYRRLIEFWAKKNGAADQDLDDISQEVYRVVVSRINDFRSSERKGSFRKWLSTIARFVCLELKRKRGGPAIAKGGTEAVIQLNNIHDPMMDDGEDDPRELVNDLVQRAIMHVRYEYSSRDWAVVEMVVIEKAPISQAATALNLSPANVRQIKSRFLRRLRSELDGFSPAVIGKSSP